jgi:hypothetical protein
MNMNTANTENVLIEQPTAQFYTEVVRRLNRCGIPFLVGGAFAYSRYSGIDRNTKDLDLFMRPVDATRAFALLEEAGYETELVFRHWLGKIRQGDCFVDVIFSSGNGVASVDEEWFEYAVPDKLLGVPVRLCPPEETIWSKAFIQERERFDGADVLHLLAALGPSLAWDRLLARFGDHWRVLLAHVVLFGFVYPDLRDAVPDWVQAELLRRFEGEGAEKERRVCYGTLLSRAQYRFDIDQLGYEDPRLPPEGVLDPEDVEAWTAAIDDKPSD